VEVGGSECGRAEKVEAKVSVKGRQIIEGGKNECGGKKGGGKGVLKVRQIMDGGRNKCRGEENVEERRVQRGENCGLKEGGEVGGVSV